MFKLRDELVKRLELLPNVKVAFWKDTDLLCVLHKDKEVAHFQNGHEIDIRLTPAIIKKRGLHPPQDTASHLDRSKRSRWLVQSFVQAEELDRIVELVQVATEL